MIVTLIADNYFGYCKKEVKTQISYAANLYGNVEEEHAGGALAFAELQPRRRVPRRQPQIGNGRHRSTTSCSDYGAMMDVQPEGYGVDKHVPATSIYVPEDVHMRASTASRCWWPADGDEQSIPLLPGKVYMHPVGLQGADREAPGRAELAARSARDGEGTFCHKPCTVSGGGKSEISKSITRLHAQYGPIFVADLEKDLDAGRARSSTATTPTAGCRELPAKPDYSNEPSRPILSPERSLGSVIKLLTPSPGEYTDEYNAWLASIPTTSARWCSSSSGSTGRSGATTGASTSASTWSTASPATS